MTDFNSTFRDHLTTPLPPVPSAHDIAVESVRRDQRRTRLLAILCIVFWALGVAGMLLMLIGLNQFVMGVRLNNFQRYLQLQDQQSTKPSNGEHGIKGETDEQDPNPVQADAKSLNDARQLIVNDGTDLIHHSLPLIDGSLAALMLAALLTVLLIFSSRRTTLNRINISLAQISEQLKQTLQTPASDGTKPPDTG